MNRLLLLLASLGLGSTAFAVVIGQSAADVEAELGKPLSQLEAPGRSIARWKDLEVTFVDGRVKSFSLRDLAGEAASEARRKQEAEAVKKRQAEIEAETRRAEEERRAQEERERPERERLQQAQKIAELEAQLETERKLLQALTEKLDAQRTEERAARMNSLRKEISTLRLEIQSVRASNETERATRLRGELLAKESELNLLTGRAR